MSPSRFFLCILLGLAAAASVAHAQTATAEGRVLLPKIVLSAPAGGARYGIAPTGEGEAAPDPPVAVVYLEGSFPDRPAQAPAAVQMAQQHAQFAPGLLAIQVGTTVEFPNLDDFYHNVFSYSKVKRFDLGRYRKDEKPATQLFDKPGVVTLHCEIHESMRGTILVLETPYFTRTDAAGNYRLPGLPAGRYQLKAWLSEKTTLEHAVELTPGGVVHVSFP